MNEPRTSRERFSGSVELREPRVCPLEGKRTRDEAIHGTDTADAVCYNSFRSALSCRLRLRRLKILGALYKVGVRAADVIAADTKRDTPRRA